MDDFDALDALAAKKKKKTTSSKKSAKNDIAVEFADDVVPEVVATVAVEKVVVVAPSAPKSQWAAKPESPVTSGVPTLTPAVADKFVSLEDMDKVVPESTGSPTGSAGVSPTAAGAPAKSTWSARSAAPSGGKLMPRDYMGTTKPKVEPKVEAKAQPKVEPKTVAAASAETNAKDGATASDKPVWKPKTAESRTMPANYSGSAKPAIPAPSTSTTATPSSVSTEVKAEPAPVASSTEAASTENGTASTASDKPVWKARTAESRTMPANYSGSAKPAAPASPTSTTAAASTTATAASSTEAAAPANGTTSTASDKPVWKARTAESRTMPTNYSGSAKPAAPAPSTSTTATPSSASTEVKAEPFKVKPREPVTGPSAEASKSADGASAEPKQVYRPPAGAYRPPSSK